MSLRGLIRLLSRKAAWVLGVAVIIGAAVPQSAAAQDQLGGQYQGIDEAQGWSVTLTALASGGFDGLLVDQNGATYPFTAGGDVNLAEARVEISGQPLYLRFSPRPVGLVSFWIPISPEGEVLVEQTRPYAFLREGVKLPDMPERLSPPPEQVGGYQEPVSFLSSYEFWQPQEVGRGYSNLSEPFRALIRLYAHVHTDVLWKLCQSRGTPPGIVEALQGQNVVCPDVLGAVAEAQRTGAFERYKTDLTAQKQMLIDAVRCTQGGLTEEQCVTVSKFTSQAAISLETARTVLSRY